MDCSSSGRAQTLLKKVMPLSFCAIPVRAYIAANQAAKYSRFASICDQPLCRLQKRPSKAANLIPKTSDKMATTLACNSSRVHALHGRDTAVSFSFNFLNPADLHDWASAAARGKTGESMYFASVGTLPFARARSGPFDCIGRGFELEFLWVRDLA